MLKICVIGLGYVGLPICLELSKKYKTTGFDINKSRIASLKKDIDLKRTIYFKIFVLAEIRNFCAKSSSSQAQSAARDAAT